MYTALLLIILVCSFLKEYWPRAVGRWSSSLTNPAGGDGNRPEQDEYG